MISTCHNLAIFFQTEPGVFGMGGRAHFTLGNEQSTPEPNGLELADLSLATRPVARDAQSDSV